MENLDLVASFILLGIAIYELKISLSDRRLQKKKIRQQKRAKKYQKL
jgi:hypothetical protein